MSWHYLAAQEGESLEACCSDGELLQPLKSKITHAEFYSNGKLTESYLDSLSGTKSEPSTASLGEGKLTLSAEDFRVRTSVAPGKVKALLEREAAYGAKWLESLVKFDPDTSSWKTHRCLWEEDLPASSVILPRWGMMRDGVCSERVMQEHPTSGTVSGSWPTPRCFMHKDAGYDRGKANLGEVVSGKEGATKDCPIIGQLNPDWTEWLMGWPVGWTDLKPLVMDKCHNARHSHGEFYQETTD